MPLVLHNGRVFQFKRKHTWKESWLSLEKNGTLTWKRKDGYQVKGTIFLPEFLQQIKVEAAEEKHLDGNGLTPFFMVLPIKLDQGQKVSMERFAVMNGQDLGIWLDSFATAVNEWKLFQTVRDQHMHEQAQSKEIGDESVESLLTYNELVYLYKGIWEDYLRQHLSGQASKKSNSGGTKGQDDAMSESENITTSEEKSHQQNKVSYKTV